MSELYKNIILKKSINLVNQWGWSELMFAVANNNIKLFYKLIGNGSNFNIRNNFGETLLMVASKLGHERMVYTLLSFHVKVDEIDNQGNTALIHAVIHSRIHTIRLLMKHGANPNIKNRMGKNATSYAVSNGNLDITQCLLGG